MELGSYLKAKRIELKLSMNDVYNVTGITASRLSKLERGMMKDPPASLLCKLAELYGLEIDSVLITAGYIDKKPNALQKTDLLNKEEKYAVQQMIDVVTKGRG